MHEVTSILFQHPSIKPGKVNEQTLITFIYDCPYLTHLNQIRAREHRKKKSDMGNGDKLRTEGTQDVGKLNKDAICVRHRYEKTSTINVSTI